MAHDVGAGVMTLLRRGIFPGRSGDLQLILSPYGTANYPNESRALALRDPRSSHALAWGYTQRVPIVIHAPGIVSRPGDFTDPVTLADLAPTTARLIRFQGFDGADGSALPGVPDPAVAPKVVVTFVIDGGGWNVLTHWPSACPNLARLMREGLTYRNAIVGSFPSVTASAHVTIGTGVFPWKHGISGHHVREGGHVVPAYGLPGEADPSFLLAPTLAERWSEHTNGRAWVGEIGYQIWHLGMIGRGGGRPPGGEVVAMYWDEARSSWSPQNPDLYRMVEGTPPREALSRGLQSYFGPERGGQIDREGRKEVCCSPPIVRYQGDVVAAAFEREPIGTDEVTDLLYVNYKMPDYAGHVYNMLSVQERIALTAVDAELGRLRRILEARFRPGEFVLIVTADHGQCPLVDSAGGVRLDPIQLSGHLSGQFDRSLLWNLVQDVKPSEAWIDHRALWDGGFTLEDLAAGLSRYRYEDNLGPYVAEDLIDRTRLRRAEFAGVFPVSFLTTLPSARHPGSRTRPVRARRSGSPAIHVTGFRRRSDRPSAPWRALDALVFRRRVRRGTRTWVSKEPTDPGGTGSRRTVP